MNEEKFPEIGLVGLNHKSAPIEIRELFTLDGTSLAAFYEKCCESAIEEIVYIATCNRVEIYFTTRDMNSSLAAIEALLEEISSIPINGFQQYIYKMYSRDAVAHLFTVSSSLDSMVVGENEIVNQVKKYYRVSVMHKMTGPVINKLFHHAFRTAKKVKSETEISKNPLSIAFIAVELARKIFDDFSNRRALLIGAGEMGEVILKFLSKYNLGDITIANRSLTNAELIASAINRQAHIIPLDDIAETAIEIDIIIASAAAQDFIVNYETVTANLLKREGKPLFIIDIAVPRNVDPKIGKMNSVFLYNIDDLKSIADENLKHRLKEVDLASALIESEADNFIKWYEGLTVAPAISSLWDRFNSIRCDELDKYRRKKLKHLSDEDFLIIEELTEQVMKKTLHNPITYLKKCKDDAKQENGGLDILRETARMIEEIFKK